jgi:hypothetical protein
MAFMYRQKEAQETIQIRAIQHYALSRPVVIDSWKRKITIYMRTFYNSIASWLGMQQLSLRPEFEKMFQQLKYTDDEAKRETDNLLLGLQNDLMGPYVMINADHV